MYFQIPGSEVGMKKHSSGRIWYKYEHPGATCEIDTWTGEERHVTFILLRLRNVKSLCTLFMRRNYLSGFFRKHA